MTEYCGSLDVHKEQSTFVIARRTGELVARGAFATTHEGLAAWGAAHALPAGTPIALETGTLAFFVADELVRLGLRPVVVDAHEVRQKAHRPRQKSDRRDAFELCEGLRTGIYRAIVHVPAPALRTVRALLARRRHFVRVQSAQVNAAKHGLRAVGRGGLARSLRTAAGWTKLHAAVAADPTLTAALRAYAAVWTAAHAERTTVETALAAAAAPYAEAVARLETMPGVGPIVALTAIATFADVHRFPGAKQAASYAGLVPSTYQSGRCDRHGHITKRGASELRAMLSEAAHHAARPAHPLHAFFTKVCVRHGYKTAVVAVAHRLCRILFALLRDGTTFHATALGLAPAPATRRRRRGLRIVPMA